jgi:hypothetical protein
LQKASVPAQRLLGGDGRSYRDPAWSPDGRELAFALTDGGASTLHLLDVASGARRALPADAERGDGHPAFAADGDDVFFEGVVDGEPAIYVWRRLSDAVARVTEWGVPSRRPVPITRELLLLEREFTYPRAMAGLVLRNLQTLRERRLGERDVDAREPTCHRTRAGRVRVLFSAPSEGGGRWDVYAATLRALNLNETTEQPGEPDEPAAPSEPAARVPPLTQPRPTSGALGERPRA